MQKNIWIIATATLALPWQMLHAEPKKTFEPTYSADSIIVFNTRDIELKKNEEILLNVPEKYHKRILDFASLTHRQDPREENECPSTPKSDCLPAFSSLDFLTYSGWRSWAGKGSGPRNSKFAEIRSGIGETDNMYEWRRKGHMGMDGQVAKSPLSLSSARVVSLGEDSVRVNGVIIKFLPPKPTEMVDIVFSEGFSFGDYETGYGRRYPGNADQGDYGRALRIRRGDVPSHQSIPADWIVGRGQVRIPLKAGKSLSFIDVAVGDMRRVPKGGDPEQFRGGARVNIELISAGRSSEILMKSENVGTNGVMRATPASHTRVFTTGEFLELEIPKGTASIMGIRLGYL